MGVTPAERSGAVPPETSHAIDVTRGLSALGVIWGHAIYGFELPLELNGAFWVWIFLPLSGYLVVKSLEDEAYGRSLAGYGRFLRNRALRIVPLAWIALAAGVVLEQTSTTAEASVDVWRQFLFIPPVNAMTLSGPLWTVAAEMQFYVAALIVGAAALSRRRAVVGWLLFATSVWFAARAIPLLGDNLSQPRTLAGNLPFFMFGVALAAGRLDAAVSMPRGLAVAAVGTLVAISWYLQNFRADYFWAWGPYRQLPFGGAAACAMAVAAVVVCGRVTSSRASRLSPGARALAWCGFHTYGIYVYHSILTKANNTQLHLSPGVFLLAFLLISVALAPVSYRMIERPLLRFKARRRDRAAFPGSSPAGARVQVG